MRLPAIKDILAMFHQPWMDADDRAEFDRQLLLKLGETMESLNDKIEQGIARGYSAEAQRYLINRLILAGRELGCKM